MACSGLCVWRWNGYIWTVYINSCEGEGCTCGPAPSAPGTYIDEEAFVDCPDGTTTSSSSSTTTTTTTPCPSSCIYVWTMGAWVLVSGNCGTGCFCWVPSTPGIEGAVAVESCRDSVQPTTTSTTTTPTCENSGCSYVWMSGMWVSVTVCLEGCTCAGPSYDGTTEGETASTSCVGTSTTTTSSTPGTCTYQSCIYRWNGSAWVSAVACPDGCYCGSPPARAGAFTGEYVSASCQSTPPTTTTTTSSTTTTTTTGTGTTTSTTTSTTTTTTTPCAGRCCIRDIHYDNGLTYSEIITNDCIDTCNCNLPNQPAYAFGVPTQWRMYGPCGTTIYPQVTTTTSTEPPCTGTCTWRWSAVSNQWVPYGASGSYWDSNKCRSSVQIGSNFYLRKCSCIYPTTTGTTDNEITTTNCGKIDCTNCGCADRWWCDDSGVAKRRPNTLTVTFHDDDGVWPCMDGVTLTLIRPEQSSLVRPAYMLAAMVEVPACVPSLFNSTSGDPIRFRCDTACGGVPGYHGTSAGVAKTLWITGFNLWPKSYGYGYRLGTAGVTSIYNNCTCGTETISKKATEFGVFASVGTYMRTGANGAIGTMCTVETMAAFANRCGYTDPYEPYPLKGNCVFDSCTPVSYTGSFTVAKFVSFFAFGAAESYTFNYGATAGSIYYTITE